ncbi:tRNA dimethylallyltransferase, mitochondrial, partial [Coemansia erecta]
MSSGGEGNLWQQLWAQARRLSADKQKPLFDYEMEAEKALHYLEGIPVYTLFSGLLPAVFLISYERLYRQPVIHRIGCLRERLELLGNKIAVQVEWSTVDPESPVYSSIMDDLEELEVQTSRCVSLLYKFPGQYRLVEALVEDGQAIVDDRAVQKAVFKALSKHSNIMAASPESREYVFSADLPGISSAETDTRQHMHVVIEENKTMRVVYGRTTGVGKSQLAIELARAVNGEVINADAMQVYKGYDIITNKVTKEETLGVPHHLIGFVEPNKEYSVQRFEQDALQKISEIHQRNRVPILVGGTNYYIQSVLFRKSLISNNRTAGSLDDLVDAEKTPAEREFEASKSDVGNQELWEELQR